MISGFPSGSDGIFLQCWRLGFDPWVRKIHWRREWQPIAVILPGASHGQRSRVGYSPRGQKELDMTEATQHACSNSSVFISISNSNFKIEITKNKYGNSYYFQFQISLAYLLTWNDSNFYFYLNLSVTNTNALISVNCKQDFESY